MLSLTFLCLAPTSLLTQDSCNQLLTQFLHLKLNMSKILLLISIPHHTLTKYKLYEDWEFVYIVYWLMCLIDSPGGLVIVDFVLNSQPQEAITPVVTSLKKMCSVTSSSLWPPGLQHTRLPCLSPSPRVCSNSCPLSWWCHHQVVNLFCIISQIIISC